MLKKVLPGNKIHWNKKTTAKNKIELILFQLVAKAYLIYNFKCLYLKKTKMK